MKNLYKIVLVILVFLLVFISGYISGIKTKKKYELNTTHKTVYDTIPYINPIQRDSVVIRYIRRELKDTTGKSVKVIVPLTQKVYSNDSTYTAWISGYDTKLESLRIFNKTEFVTNTVTKKQSRFNFGLGVGYGIGSTGAHPFVGVCLFYRLFGF